jgi:indole-3-glycerol phosphate synthase
MSGGDFLRRMADASRARVRAARLREPEQRLLRRAVAAAPPPRLRLGNFDLIAELKLRSPAAGGLAGSGFDRTALISAYANGGAAAVSVLTEPDEFCGDLAHLREAADVLRPFGCPVMRKDFLTDPYQVIEARAAGAGGVLLIVTMLDDTELRAMLAVASDLGLFALLEGFDSPL